MPIIGYPLLKASRRKLKVMLRRHQPNGETGVNTRDGLSSVCPSSCWSDADDSLLSVVDCDLDPPDTNAMCESICSVNEHALEHEHGNNTRYSTGSSTQSITVTSPELVAQVSRLEALLSNQNAELNNNNNNSCRNNNDDDDHDSHSYYGSENDDDDSLANELEQLTESEQALRRELDQYQSYSQLSIHEDHSDNNTESEFLEALPVESDCSLQPISDTSVAAASDIKIMGVPAQEELSPLCPAKQEPFIRDNNATATTITATTITTAAIATTSTSQDSAADCHDESCSERSDSDSTILYSLQEEDLVTIPEQTPLDLSCATRVAVKGGWDWEMPLEISDYDSTDTDSDNDYSEDSCSSDEQANNLPNACAAFAHQAVVPAKRVALLGGGEWGLMRRGDVLFLLLADENDSDSSSDPHTALALPVPAKRAAVLGGGEWEMMRKGDFFLDHDDSDDSSSDQLDNDTEKSIGSMDAVAALAQPLPVLPAKRASVFLGGGQWESSLKYDLTDDDDSDSSSDPLNQEAEALVAEQAIRILPLAASEGRSNDDAAAILQTEQHHQWGRRHKNSSRMVSYFVMIAFIIIIIIITMLMVGLLSNWQPTPQAAIGEQDTVCCCGNTILFCRGW
jgi:hypothetical protein